MRLLFLLTGAALTLGGCDRDNRAQESQSVEESLTANSIVANDITAIDAVTADAANMAADVDINFTNDQVLYNGSGSAQPRPPATASEAPAKRTSEAPRRRAPAPARATPQADNASD